MFWIFDCVNGEEINGNLMHGDRKASASVRRHLIDNFAVASGLGGVEQNAVAKAAKDLHVSGRSTVWALI